MFDPAQSNDPLQVPQMEPVSFGNSSQPGGDSQPSGDSQSGGATQQATPDDIEKIASSLEVDIEHIAANSTSDSVDETAVVPQKSTTQDTTSTQPTVEPTTENEVDILTPNSKIVVPDLTVGALGVIGTTPVANAVSATISGVAPNL